MKLLLEPGSGALQRPSLGHPRVNTRHVLTDVRLTIATFHSPLPKFSVPEVARGAAGLGRLFHPTESRVRQNYCRNAGAGPWSPHARQHSAALSTCHTTASTEKERRSITLDGQRSSGGRVGGPTSVSSAERRRAGCRSHDTRGGAQGIHGLRSKDTNQVT